jgi:hypothetical protein
VVSCLWHVWTNTDLTDELFYLVLSRFRPLTDEMLCYAREDTHYLLYIYDMMKNSLIQKGNTNKNLLLSVLDKSRLVCSKVCHYHAKYKTEPCQGCIRAVWPLNKKSKSIGRSADTLWQSDCWKFCNIVLNWFTAQQLKCMHWRCRSQLSPDSTRCSGQLTAVSVLVYEVCSCQRARIWQPVSLLEVHFYFIFSVHSGVQEAEPDGGRNPDSLHAKSQVLQQQANVRPGKAVRVEIQVSPTGRRIHGLYSTQSYSPTGIPPTNHNPIQLSISQSQSNSILHQPFTVQLSYPSTNHSPTQISIS